MPADTNRSTGPASAPCPWTDLEHARGHLDLESFPSFVLLRVANAVQQEVTGRYLEPMQLSTTEWRLLARLTRSAPIGFGALCRISFFDKAHVSRTLRELERRGLVTMTTDPAHARRVVVDITASGRAVVRRTMPIARREQVRLLRTLDAGERAALYSALRKLQRLVDTAQQPGAIPDLAIDA